MKRTGRRPSGNSPQESSFPLGRCKSSEGSQLMEEDRRGGSESNGSSTEEGVFTPNDYSGSKKNTINIKIKKKANGNLQHSKNGGEKEEQKSFIKSLIGKIEEMYKKGSREEKRNSHEVPLHPRPAFLLNEYLNVEPTNYVTYRRRTPHKTLRRSDFIGINLKPFVRFKSHQKWDDSPANRSGDPRKRAIIKISNQSPHEIFNPMCFSTNRSSSVYPKPANFYSLKSDAMRGDVPFWGDQRVKKGVGNAVGNAVGNVVGNVVGAPVGSHHLGIFTDKQFRGPNMHATPFVHLKPVQRCATYNPWCGGSAAGNVNNPGGAYHVKGTHQNRRRDDKAGKGEKRESKIRVRINGKGAGRKNEGDGDGGDGHSEGGKTESGSVNNRTHHGRNRLANEHIHLGKPNERDSQEKEKKKTFRVNLSLPLNNPMGKNYNEGESTAHLGDHTNGGAPSHVLFTSKGERVMNLHVKNRANERIRLRYAGKDGEDRESAKMCSHSTSTCDTIKQSRLLSGTYSSLGGSQQSSCRKCRKCHGSGLNIQCMHGSSEGGNSLQNKTRKGRELHIYEEGTTRRSASTWSKAPEQHHVQHERGLHHREDHKRMGKNSSQLRTQTEQNRCVGGASSVTRQHRNGCLQLEDNTKGEPTLSRGDCESGDSKDERHKYGVEKKSEAVKNEGKLLSSTQRNEKFIIGCGKDVPQRNCKMLTWGNSNSGSRRYTLDSSARKMEEKSSDRNREKSLTCSNSLQGQQKYKHLRTITIPSDSVDGMDEKNPRGRHPIREGEKFRGEHPIASASNMSSRIATQDDEMGKYKMVKYYKPGGKKECRGRSCICEGGKHSHSYNGVGENKGSRVKANPFSAPNELLEIKDKRGRSRSVATALSNRQRNKKREEFPPDQSGGSYPWTGSSRRGANTTAAPPNEVESSDSDSHHHNGERLFSKGKEKKTKKMNMHSKGSSLCIEGEANYNSGRTNPFEKYKSHSGNHSRRLHRFMEGTNSGARDCAVWEQSQVDGPENCLWHSTEQAYAQSGEEISRRKGEAHKNEARQSVVYQLGEGRTQVRESQTGNTSFPQKVGGRADGGISTNPDFEDHTDYSINGRMRHRSELQWASNCKGAARRDKTEKQREQCRESNSHSDHNYEENLSNLPSSQPFFPNRLQRKSRKMRSALSGDTSARKKRPHSRGGTASSGERYDKGRSSNRWGNTSSSNFYDYHGVNNVERVLYNSGVASKEEEKAGTGGGSSDRRSVRRNRSIDRASGVYHSHGRHPRGGTKGTAEWSLHHDRNSNVLSCKGAGLAKNAKWHFPVGTLPNSCVHTSHLSGSAMTSKKPTVIDSDAQSDESDESGGAHDKRVSVERSFHCGGENQFCSDGDEAIARNTQSKDGESHVYRTREPVGRKGRGVTSSERMADGRRLHNGGTHQGSQNLLSNEKRRTPQRAHNCYDEDEYEGGPSRRMRKARKRSENCHSEETSTDQFARLDNLNSPQGDESDMSRIGHGVDLHAAMCGSRERGNSSVKRYTKGGTSSGGNISNWGNILRENSSKDETGFPYGPDSMLKGSSGDIFRKGSGSSSYHHMGFISNGQKEPLCSGDEAGRSISLGGGRAPSRRDTCGKKGNNSGHSIDEQTDQRRDHHCRRGSKHAHSNRKGDYEEGEEITPHNGSPRMKDKKKHQNGGAAKCKEARRKEGKHNWGRLYGHSEGSQRSGSISEGSITSRSGRHAIYERINRWEISRSNSSLHEEIKKRVKSGDPSLGAHHGGNRHCGHTAQGDRHRCYSGGEGEKKPSRGASKWDAAESWVGEENRRDEYVHMREDGMSSNCRIAQPAANQLCGKNSEIRSIPHVSSNQEGTRERGQSHCSSASLCINSCREEEVTPPRYGSSYGRTSEMEKKRTLQESQNSVGHNQIGNERMSCSRDGETILRSSEKGEITQGGFPSKTNEYPPNVDRGEDNELLPSRRDSPLMSCSVEPKRGEATRGNVSEKMEASKLTPMVKPPQFNIVGSANAVEGPIRAENPHPNNPPRNNGQQIVLSKTVSGVVGLKRANEYMKSELNYYLSGGHFAKGSRHCCEEANGKVETPSEAFSEANSFRNGIIRVDVDPPQCCSIGAVDTVDAVGAVSAVSATLGGDSNTANRLGNYQKGESHERGRSHVSSGSLFRGGQHRSGSLDHPSDDHTNVNVANTEVGSAPLNDPPSNGEEGNFSKFNEGKSRSGFDRQNEKIKFNNGMYGYADVGAIADVRMVNPGDTTNLRNNHTLYGYPNNAVPMSKQYSFLSDPTHRQFLPHPSVAPTSNNFNGMHYANKAVSMPNLGNINMHSNLFNAGIGNKIGDPVNVTRSDIPSAALAQANQLPPQQMMHPNVSKAFHFPTYHGNVANGLNYNFANVAKNDLLISDRPYGGDIFYDGSGKAYMVGRSGEAHASSVNALGNYALPSYHLAIGSANRSNLNGDELTGQAGHASLAPPPAMLHGGSGSVSGLKKPSVLL
ncbi:hypothetical protein PVBG_04709 [Plasmodium vivax Brazil I]|uniref:Uncharacterized protein n=1 Tax=Plasmodium vivax (strain Brazil I) TaxID=1033975 RepID=A0A0J9STY3_PLAV1|nr:hypothetical protein PVBG_04709 [Plasmodium vivax Brazil I]